MSRDEMRGFKARMDEQGRIQEVNGWIQSVYQGAVLTAQRSTVTKYITRIDHENSCEFITKNWDEIHTRLQVLFPECSVEFKKIGRVDGFGRICYKHNTNEQLMEQSIVIDWS